MAVRFSQKRRFGLHPKVQIAELPNQFLGKIQAKKHSPK